MGRIFLMAAAALLLTTGIIHAGGQPMVGAWVADLPEFQKRAISLVWITDSVSWAAVSAIWAAAAWKPERGWLGASAIGIVIPLSMAVGIMTIDPSFFGGWMLLASMVLAGIGIWLGLAAKNGRVVEEPREDRSPGGG